LRSCKTPPDSHFGNRLKLRSFRARPRFMASATAPGGCAWARSAARPLTRRRRWARQCRSSQSASSSDCSDARVGLAEHAFPFQRRARPTRSIRRGSAPLLMEAKSLGQAECKKVRRKPRGRGMACTVRGLSRRGVARPLRIGPQELSRSSRCSCQANRKRGRPTSVGRPLC